MSRKELNMNNPKQAAGFAVLKTAKSSLRGRLTRSNPLITSILDWLRRATLRFDCFASLAMTENLSFETVPASRETCFYFRLDGTSNNVKQFII
ncbi:MAG: hypothetical protein LBC68_01770 [Prevotellaceae bacterium]|nr:hypothetical protein [Prevotellaceae bacterium]